MCFLIFPSHTHTLSLSLFQIEANDGTPFRKGDVVQLFLSRSCYTRSALSVDRIPGLADAVDVSDYVYLPSSGTSLFYLLQVNVDCNLLTVRAERMRDVHVIDISVGQGVSLANWSGT